jgi:hypothetical protein
VQQKQGNFKLWLFGTLLVSAGLLAGLTAAPAAEKNQPAGDPILDGGPAGPCDPGTTGPDYVAGTDMGGHPVAPADLAADPVPVPSQMLIPLKGGKDPDPAYVQADGKKLDALLNPPAACPAKAKQAGG